MPNRIEGGAGRRSPQPSSRLHFTLARPTRYYPSTDGWVHLTFFTLSCPHSLSQNTFLPDFSLKSPPPAPPSSFSCIILPTSSQEGLDPTPLVALLLCGQSIDATVSYRFPVSIFVLAHLVLLVRLVYCRLEYRLHCSQKCNDVAFRIFTRGSVCMFRY